MIFYRRVNPGMERWGSAHKFDPTKTIFTAESSGPNYPMSGRIYKVSFFHRNTKGETKIGIRQKRQKL